MYCTIGNYKIYYKIVGEGQPILTFHGGLGYDHNYLFNTTKPFHNLGQWIFWDYPGHGRSARSIKTSDITIDHIVRTSKKLCGELKIEKPLLFGHSYGGLITLAYAIKYPKAYKRLLSLCPSTICKPYNDDGLERKYKLLSRRLGKDLKMLSSSIKNNEDLEKYARLAFHLYFYKFKPGIEKHLDGSLFSNRALIQGYIEAERRFSDIMAQIHEICEEMFVLYGTHDVIVDKKNVVLIQESLGKENIKSCHIIPFQKSAHFPQVEEPKKFKKILQEFISGSKQKSV